MKRVEIALAVVICLVLPHIGLAQVTVIDTIYLGSSVGIHDLAVNTVTNLVYTANDSSVMVIDGSSHSVVDSIRLGNGFTYVCVNDSTNRIYVTGNSKIVLVVDGQTNTVVDTINISSASRCICVNQRTNRVYVGSSNHISVIDGATDSVIAIVNLSDAPEGLCVNEATNRIYAACPGGYTTIWVINGETNQLIDSLQTGFSDYFAGGIDVNDSTDLIYVATTMALAMSAYLSVFDGAADTLLHCILLNPYFISFDASVNPSTNHVFVSSFDPIAWGEFDVVDGETNRVIQTLLMYGCPRPWRICTNTKTNQIYVSSDPLCYDGSIIVMQDSISTGTENIPFPVTRITDFTLSRNYPNPFNSNTVISYQLLGGSRHRTTLKIYNILGQEVRTLVDEEQAPGYYSVSWDGRDSLGRGVGSGVYFYRIEVEEQRARIVKTREMVLLR